METFEPLRVLLVEDNPGDAVLIGEALRAPMGTTLLLDHVTSLREATSLAAQSDLILLDLGLPDSAGTETYERLRAAGCRAPVVVLTGHDDDRTAQSVVGCGAQDYIVKGSLDGHALARVLRHAVERHRLQATLEGLLRQRASLNELAQAALEGAPADELMQDAAKAISQVLDIDMAVVALVDGDDIVVTGACGIPNDVLGSRRPIRGESIAAHVVTTREPVVVPDVATETRFDDPEMCSGGAIRAGAAVPIPGLDQAMGIVAAHSSTPREFSTAELHYLGELAMTLSDAIRRDRAEHDRQEREKELSALYRVQGILQFDASPPEQYQQIADILAQAVQYPDDVVVRLAVGPVTVRGGADADLDDVADSIFLSNGWGELQVGYLGSATFLPEERQLFAAVAEAIQLQVGRRKAVEALGQNEAWLRFLVGSIPGALWTTDRDLVVTSVQGGAVGHLGVPAEELVGLPMRELLRDNPTREEAMAAYGAALEGTPTSFEIVFNDRVWHVSIEPWRSVSGEVQGIIGIGLDATEARKTTVALEESRLRLQGLFENASDGLFLADDDRRYIDVNPAAEKMTGYSRAELLTMRIDDLGDVPEIETERVWSQFLDAGILEGPWPLRLKDGGTLIADFRAVANVIPGLHLSVMRDVTEQRAAEEALRRSEERFRALVQNAADGVMITDSELRSIYVSPSMQRIIGYSAEELVGTSSFDFIHPDDFGRAASTLGWVVENRGPTAPGRFRVRHRNGTWRWVEAVATDLRDHAAVGGIVVNVRDVTEQTLVQQALAESEARFRRIAENARDIVFRVRLFPERATEYMSPATLEITGYRPEELYANPRALFDLAHPDDQPMLRAVAYKPSLLREPVVVRWLHRDGRIVWIELRATPVADQAGGLVIEGIAREITEQKEAEEALRTALEQETRAADELRRVNQMKDTFLQAVSHEMRTPLTAIVGFTGLLQQRREDLPTDRVTELLDRTAANANRLHTLLIDLLDLDRITRRATDARRTPARIDRLVSEVVSDIDFGERPVVLAIESLIVNVDVPRVERIVDNLVTNALRHTPDGTPIEVAVDRHDDGIVVRVDDRGEGVPDDLKTEIFEPFFQGDTPSSRTGGAGIGLSIVARFAELHGGRAWIEDRPGGGASFRVLLPCEVVDAT